jgi:hypothetical protein
VKRFLVFSIVFLLLNSQVLAAIKKMNYAGCTCKCNGDELAPDGNLVIVADSTQGLMFRYTGDGNFAGYIGSAIQCKPAFPFRPLKIVSGYDGIHALNIADRSVLQINAQGELVQKLPLGQAGLGSSTPSSYAWGNDLNFISFVNGDIVSCEYDLTLSNKINFPGVVSLSFSNNRLYALTSKGEVKVFTDQLEQVDAKDRFGWLTDSLKNPQDIFADDSDNVWIADTGNRRIIVLWTDATFSTWGDQAKSFESAQIAGDPILGNNQRLTPRRIVALDDFFFVTTPDHDAYSIPVANLSTRQDPTKRRFVKLAISPAHYRENLETIWNLQQELYPQTALTVEISDDAESVSINGLKVDDNPVDFITKTEIRECLTGQFGTSYAGGFSVSSSGGAIQVKATKELDQMVIVRLYSVSGGTRPLILESLDRGVLSPYDKNLSFVARNKPGDSIFLVTATADNGMFLDFYWLRLQN